jgi:hypothetical protein
MSKSLDAAITYHSLGWMPIPLTQGSKNPNRKGWQKERWTLDELPNCFNNGQNIGLLLGEPSGGLVDVDLDSPEATALADAMLPPTNRISGRSGSPFSHRWYICDPVISTAQFPDPMLANTDERAMIVELRSKGAQTIVPPSRHPNGDDYVWHQEGEAARVSAALLQTSVSTLAACSITARYWQQGKRHNLAFALSGILLRKGWTVDKTEHFIISAATVAGDDELEDRRKAIHDTAEQLKQGKPATGIPRLSALLPKDVVDRIIKWLGIQNPTPNAGTDSTTKPKDSTNWPEPEPLPNSLLPVPSLRRELLPEPFAPWLSDIAERMQCPLDYPTVGAIVALASVVGNQISIRPKRHDDWSVVPNLFGAIIGRPGVLKSPALEEAIKPLNRLMVEARKTYEQEAQDWEIERITADAKREKLKDEIRKAVKSGSDVDNEYYRAQLEEIEGMREPSERRYIINDSTVEKVGELLNKNPRGLLQFRDELTGWLRTLDRDGHESDRAFYLEAWGGKGSFTYDRIGRGTLYIKTVTLSILGGIQPGPLTIYLRHALSGGQGDDGLLQRFQLMVYPDISPQWRNVDHYPNSKDKNQAFEIFRKLHILDALQIGAAIPEETTDIPYLRFDEEAQEFFISWREDLEKELRSGSIEHPALEAHQAKYRSLMPSLALLFHLIDRVDGQTQAASVSLDSAAKAAAWCSYLLEHAKRIYGMASNASATQARLIIEKIKSGALKDKFSARDVYRNQWTGLTSASETAEPLTLLEDFGWIRSATEKSGTSGGRPKVYYIVNPKVKDGR